MTKTAGMIELNNKDFLKITDRDKIKYMKKRKNDGTCDKKTIGRLFKKAS